MNRFRSRSSLISTSLISALMLSCSSDGPEDMGQSAEDMSVAQDFGPQMGMDAGPDTGPEDTGAMDSGAPDNGTLDSGTPDMGAVTGIPEPPMMPAFDWTDTEPNNTPQQAQAVGTLDFALWMGFGAVPNTINANDDVDYYVFRAPGANELANILPEGFTIFWNADVNLLDMRLYEVNGGTLGAMIREATAETNGVEVLMDGTEAPNVLTPGGVYLLEIAAAPGLDLGGMPESYGA